MWPTGISAVGHLCLGARRHQCSVILIKWPAGISAAGNPHCSPQASVQRGYFEPPCNSSRAAAAVAAAAAGRERERERERDKEREKEKDMKFQARAGILGLAKNNSKLGRDPWA